MDIRDRAGLLRIPFRHGPTRRKYADHVGLRHWRDFAAEAGLSCSVLIGFSTRQGFYSRDWRFRVSGARVRAIGLLTTSVEST